MEDIPLKPAARALYNERIDNNGKDHPGAYCLPSGIPEKDNIPDGLKVVQTEDLTLLLHESRTIYRQIFTDGRPLPKDAQPTWMGYSIGRWDNDTFIVETILQNGRTWLDMKGLPGTEHMRVTEKFMRPRVGLMDIEVTIDDPEIYTRPWKVNMAWRLLPDTDVIESIVVSLVVDVRTDVLVLTGRIGEARVVTAAVATTVVAVIVVDDGFPDGYPPPPPKKPPPPPKKPTPRCPNNEDKLSNAISPAITPAAVCAALCRNPENPPPCGGGGAA